MGVSGGGRCNLENESKRVITPALKRGKMEWHGWYSLRRFHGTQVRKAATSETMSKALGNTRVVADKHYLKSTEVLPDVRKAVVGAMAGLTKKSA